MLTLADRIALDTNNRYACAGPVWCGLKGQAGISSYTGDSPLVRGIFLYGPRETRQRDQLARVARKREPKQTHTERRVEQLRLLGGEDFIPAVERLGRAVKANGAKRAA
jgi:hypothetical protein